MEVYGEEPGMVAGWTISERVRFLELLHFLKFDRNQIVGVGRADFNEAKSRTKGILDFKSQGRAQVLGRDEEGFYEVLVGWRPKRGSLLADHIETGQGYVVGPFGFNAERYKITLLGNQKQIRRFLGQVEDHGLSYKVASVMNASFSPDSLLSCLTEKQRRVLVSAFRLGYYDIPRKLDTDKLADKLNLVNSTVVEHIRKAERRMLAQMLGESRTSPIGNLHPRYASLPPASYGRKSQEDIASQVI